MDDTKEESNKLNKVLPNGENDATSELIENTDLQDVHQLLLDVHDNYIDDHDSYRQVAKNYINKSKHPINEKFSPLFKQVLVAAGPITMQVSKGISAGYSATLLPELRSPDSGFLLTLSQESWIASCIIPIMAVGCIVGGYLTDKFGRKVTHIWWCLPFTLSWMVIAFATNYETLLAGRLINGFIGGIITPPAFSYIGETSSPKYRGFLTSSLTFGISSGILLVHFYGTFLDWRTTAIVSSIFPIICLLQMWCLPESPAWLLRNKRQAEAEEALYWCKGFSLCTFQELVRMIQSQNKSTNEKHSSRQLILELKKPTFIKPFLIINFYHLIAQWSGNNMLCFYAVTIAKQTIGDGLNEYFCMIIIDLIRTILSAVICVLLKSFGIRPFTFISGYGCGACMMALAGVIFYSKHIPYASIPFILLTMFIAFITIGFMPVPWNLMGELYPLSVRSFAGGVSSFIAFMAFFSVIKTGPFMLKGLGEVATFTIYGVSSLIGTTVLYFILPETKGKTLQEIEDGFKNE